LGNRYLTVDKGITNIRDGPRSSVDPVTGENLYPAVSPMFPSRDRLVMDWHFMVVIFLNC